MPTIADIFTQVRLDFPSQSDAELLSDAQSIHDELCFDFKLIPGTLNLNVTAGTSEYSLTGDHVTVYSADYARSATDAEPLRVSHPDEMDEFRPNWRREPASTPSWYYVESGKVGLVPAPSASTSGTYPRLELRTGQRQTLALTPSPTNLPAGLVSYQAWVDGIKARAAIRVSDQRATSFAQMYDASRRRLSEQLHSSARRYRRTFLPRLFGGGNDIV